MKHLIFILFVLIVSCGRETTNIKNVYMSSSNATVNIKLTTDESLVSFEPLSESIFILHTYDSLKNVHYYKKIYGVREYINFKISKGK